MSFMKHTIRFKGFFRPNARSVGRWLIATGLSLVIFASLSLTLSVQADWPTDRAKLLAFQDAGQGQQIFTEKCAGCHSIGGGKLVGPDLKDVTTRRDSQWVKSFIADPAKMIASDATAMQLSKDYATTMPALGLSAAEIDAVLVYLNNPGAVPAAPAVAAGAGNPDIGKRLFTGEQALANGGTACIACHSVSGAGVGGGLGPDLTNVVQRLGQPGLSASIKTIAFPTMIGPFQNKPLTAAEQADLVAFFQQANQFQPPQQNAIAGAISMNALLVFTISLVGALVLFGLLMVLWSRQNKHHTTHLPVRKL